MDMFVLQIFIKITSGNTAILISYTRSFAIGVSYRRGFAKCEKNKIFGRSKTAQIRVLQYVFAKIRTVRASLECSAQSTFISEV